MKSFYTLLAAAVVAFSASAVNLNVERAKQVRTLEPAKKEAVAQAKKPAVTKIAKVERSVDAKLMGARKVSGNTGIEGTWEFQLGDYYFQTSIGSYMYEFEATLEGDIVVFEDPTGYEMPFLAEYNEATGALTFGREYLGTASGYYVYQEAFIYNYDTNDLDVQTITARYDKSSDSILFGADNGISWAAYTSQFATSPAGYFGIYDLEGAIKVSGGNDEDDDANWEDLGNATFIDGWVLPLFGLDQNEWAFEVPLQRNTENTNLYRLVDPYHTPIFAEVNSSTTKGYILIDVTDPDHVVIGGADAGFAYPSAGITKFYCYNMLGMYVAATGYDADLIVSLIGDGIGYTTFKDGVITLGSYEDPEYGLTYDANFGYQADPIGGYSWQDNSGTPADMSAKIIFPVIASEGVEGEGTMITQLDMNMGMLEEPELLDPETYQVHGAFADGKLTITNFGDYDKIVFTIDLATGEAVAANQVAYVDEDFEYFFSDVQKKETTVYGTIKNFGDSKSQLVIEPWGEGMDFPDFGFFFNAAYYNTEITFDFAIPGLEVTAEEPVITIGEVTYNAYPDATVNFVVPVTATGLAEDAVITVYYKGPNNDDFVAVEANHEQYDFTIGGLAYATDYTITIYAASGNVKSEEVVVSFTTYAEVVADPVAEIFWADVDDITDTTAIAYVTPGFRDLPADAKAFVIVTLNSENDGVGTRTDFKVEVENAAERYGWEVEVELTGLTPGTEYEYMVAGQVENAEGEILTRSNLFYGSFVTTGTQDGISNVEVAGENARYFNLQGIEVEKPAAGNTYIKVVGNTANKVIVK